MKYECERCRIPGGYYDLKIEPSIANPDFTMPSYCREGHFWVLAEEESQAKRGGYE